MNDPARPAAPPPLFDLDFDLVYVWQAVRRRWKLAASLAGLVVAVTAVVVFATRPVYEASTLILIEKIGANTLEREGVALDSTQDDYYQTQYQILQSRTLAERVAGDLRLAAYPEFGAADPAGVLQRDHMRVEPLRRTRLVKVVASSYRPELAMAIANTLARRYIEEALSSKLFFSRELLKSLDGKGAARTMDSLPAVVNNTLIQQLKGDLATRKGEWAELTQRYRPDHPRMRQLQAHIRATQAQIEVEVRHIVASVKIQLSGEFKGSSVQIVDPARLPATPARPRKGRALLLALVLGALGAVALAVLVDRWDLTLRTADDVERFLHLRNLGSIPELPGLGPDRALGYKAVWGSADGAAMEAFRNLRTAISFRLAGVTGPTVIQVTSTVQEEGKSFVSANLARAYALAGERVLLIDGDLRRPSVHQIFGLETGTGLSKYLSNGAGAPSQVPSGVPNLTILPCGPIPDNPPELLAERKLAALVEWAGRNYDRIIVDCPPVLPVSDALLWARHAHGVLLVVAAGKARVAAVQRACRRLKDSFANVIGATVNRSRREAMDHYRYSYGYGDTGGAAGPKPAAVLEGATRNG